METSKAVDGIKRYPFEVIWRLAQLFRAVHHVSYWESVRGEGCATRPGTALSRQGDASSSRVTQPAGTKKPPLREALLEAGAGRAVQAPIMAVDQEKNPA